MANSFTQGTGVQGTSTALSQAKAFTSNVAAGSLLVACVISDRTGATTNSVSDNLNGAWTKIGSTLALGTRDKIDIWYFKNSAAGACTVTASVAASAFISLGIAEAAGADTSAPAGNTNTGNGTGTAAATGAVTIATAGEILFGVVTQTGSQTTITPDTGNGWTEIFEAEAAAGMPINWVYKLVSANDAPAWTLGASRTWGAVAGAFKAAAAAAALAPYYFRQLVGSMH